MTSLIVNCPKQTDVSYENHEKEKLAIFENLKRRAKNSCDIFLIVLMELNVKNFSGICIFPIVILSNGAFSAAIAQGITVDTLYALSLLGKTRFFVVPACIIGQEKGRFGFLTIFLPLENEIFKVIKQVKDYHGKFSR